MTRSLSAPLELCRDRRTVTADTALILAQVFGNSPDFWLNTQRRADLWEALNTPTRLIRIQRAKPIGMAKRPMTISASSCQARLSPPAVD